MAIDTVDGPAKSCITLVETHPKSWDVYPAWKTYKKLLKMAIEIVSFPINNGGSFYSYVNVYQRVPPINWCITDDLASIVINGHRRQSWMPPASKDIPILHRFVILPKYVIVYIYIVMLSCIIIFMML